MEVNKKSYVWTKVICDQLNDFFGMDAEHGVAVAFDDDGEFSYWLVVSKGADGTITPIAGPFNTIRDIYNAITSGKTE